MKLNKFKKIKPIVVFTMFLVFTSCSSFFLSYVEYMESKGYYNDKFPQSDEELIDSYGMITGKLKVTFEGHDISNKCIIVLYDKTDNGLGETSNFPTESHLLRIGLPSHKFYFSRLICRISKHNPSLTISLNKKVILANKEILNIGYNDIVIQNSLWGASCKVKNKRNFKYRKDLKQKEIDIDLCDS